MSHVCCRPDIHLLASLLLPPPMLGLRVHRKYARMAHLDLETWREQDKRKYNSEVIDPGVDYTGPCLDKLSKKKLAQMQASVTSLNYKQAVECVSCQHKNSSRLLQ